MKDQPTRKAHYTTHQRDNLLNEIDAILQEVLQIAESNETSSFRYAVPVFCALKLEAFINIAGAEIYVHWNDLERKLNFKEKLNFLSSLKGISVEWGIEPAQTVTNVFYLRNEIIHAKPHEYKNEETVSIEVANSRPSTFDWEYGVCNIRKKMSDEKLPQMVENVDAFIQQWKKPLLGDKADEILWAMGLSGYEIIDK